MFIHDYASLTKHNIKSKFPPKEPHQICQCNKLFKLKPSMGSRVVRNQIHEN